MVDYIHLFTTQAWTISLEEIRTTSSNIKVDGKNFIYEKIQVKVDHFVFFIKKFDGRQKIKIKYILWLFLVIFTIKIVKLACWTSVLRLVCYKLNSSSMWSAWIQVAVLLRA